MKIRQYFFTEKTYRDRLYPLPLFVLVRFLRTCDLLSSDHVNDPRNDFHWPIWSTSEMLHFTLITSSRHSLCYRNLTKFTIFCITITTPPPPPLALYCQWYCSSPSGICIPSSTWDSLSRTRDIPWEKLLLGTCSHNASIISYKHANNNLRKAVSSEQRNWIVIWSVWLLCLKLNQKSLTFNKVLLAKCLVEPRVKLSVRFHLWRFGLSPELEL